jgi:enoyl reductase-like protein
MTPSTVKAGFVSAVLDVGYHIELAGTAPRSKVAEIQNDNISLVAGFSSEMMYGRLGRMEVPLLI